MKVLTVPENWLFVADSGNPADGLYLAMHTQNESDTVVELLSYNTICHGTQGWVKEDTNENCEVVAYYPENLDMDGLLAVRIAIKEKL